MIGLLIGGAFAAIVVLGCLGAWAGNRVADAVGLGPEPDPPRSPPPSTVDAYLKEAYTRDIEDQGEALRRQRQRFEEAHAELTRDGVLWQRGEDVELRMAGIHYRFDGKAVYEQATGRVVSDVKIKQRLHALFQEWEERREAKKRKAQWAERDTKAKENAADPLGLKSWRKARHGDYRVTLNSGAQYEGHILWKSFPDAAELTAFNNQDGLREHLQRLAQQIEWKQHEEKRENS